MLAIVVGLLLSVSVALGILALVALPNLRQGSQVLSPHGQRAVRRVKQQARQKPAAAAGGTRHGLLALKRLLARLSRGVARLSVGAARQSVRIARLLVQHAARTGRRIARAWAPVSAALHGLMDQLEARDEADRNGTERPDIDAVRSVHPPTFEPAPEQHRPSAEQSDGSVVADSERPAVSSRPSVGRPRAVPPTSGPIPEIAAAQHTRSGGSSTDRSERTIDLRDHKRSHADRKVGSARSAR